MTCRAIIVDDDPTCLALMEAILRRLGFDVTAVGDPGRVLEMLGKNSETYDLLVTDYQMPGIDGAQLVRLVADHFPDLPIVLVSSCMEEALARIDGHLLGGHLAKPFGELELSSVLCNALDGSSRDLFDSGSFFLS